MSNTAPAEYNIGKNMTVVFRDSSTETSSSTPQDTGRATKSFIEYLPSFDW